jgi:YNFM family putative membrane transporter
MSKNSYLGLQAIVFMLVWAAFTTIYITQPVLPVIREEFGVSEFMASLTISAVILGIALANLPFGALADRLPIRPIILTGGIVITACSLLCAITTAFWPMVLARFLQGLFIPSLTTCLAAYLARSLPIERLNVVMGSYVSATVAGGLSGRLLSGFLHPPLHWRYAFVTSGFLLLASTCAAALWMRTEIPLRKTDAQELGFRDLLSRTDLLLIYAVGFGSLFVYLSIFNYLPFYLAGPPFNAPVQMITLLYTTYIVGIIISPLAGSLSNRIGNGAAMATGSVIFALSIGATLIQSLWVIALSLAGVCAGFFTVHSAATGLLNRSLTSSRGRANSLYILFYYLGGYSGVTVSGFAYMRDGWPGVVLVGVTMLLLPFAAGLAEMKLKGK